MPGTSRGLDGDRRLAAVRAVGRALSEAAGLDEGTSEALGLAAGGLGWRRAAVWLRDEVAVGSLRLAAAWPEPSNGQVAGPRARRAAATGAASWSRPEARDAAAAGAGVAVEASIPIAAGEEVLGVLDVEGAGDGPAGGDAEALVAVAAQLALFVKERRAADGLHEVALRYRTLVEQIPAITYSDVVDEAMTTTYISPQVQTLLGVAPQEWIDDPDLWRRLLHPDDRDRAIEEYLLGRDRGEPFVYEYRMVARDGRVVWFRDDAVVLPGADGRPASVHGVMLDITERRRAEEEVAFLAYHDPLTGLPNRAMFEELLGLALARARRNDLAVAVLFLDLDDFKLVNDGLGHAAGDELLRQVAVRLGGATRATDVVARQGGDEFLLLLADLDRGPAAAAVPFRPDEGTPCEVEMAESVARRVLEALRAPFTVGGREVFASASVGVSLFPLDARDGDTLMKNADVAMYRSKNAGPGGFAMFADHRSDAGGQLSLATRLRRAVQQQHWELHYQPIVDLRSRDLVGVEALLRWHDPSGGLIAPGEFIPLAEEMGLIEAIGDWVLEELCRQAEEWRAGGMDGSVGSVGFNLSPRQLWQPDLAQKIALRLRSADLEPGRVVVEVTESTAMTDPDRTQRILRDLSARGLRIAIDDFGTGYSSLARLKHMPVDMLKIDRSFVRDVADGRDAGAMVDAMIQLALRLEMTPVAEGVETEAQWRFLVEHGCPLGQGYLFARPMHGAEVPAWRASTQPGGGPKP